MVLLQVVGAILLMLGSLLVLWAVSRMDPGAAPRTRVQRPRLVMTAQRKTGAAKSKRPAQDLPRAA
jgi:hypothetical protein